MNSTAIRLYAAAVIVVATWGISHWVQAATAPPEVEMPNWTLRELPLQLGNWHGENATLDPKIAAATGADVIVNRFYHDDANHTISLHTATFKDPAEGVYHSPLNCYRANGWTQVQDSHEDVEVADDLTIPVHLTTWQREGDRVLVVYWYQLGTHVLYSRLDLGGIRWSLRGQSKWPALVKVMLQIPVGDQEDEKAALLGFTERMAKWLNQPEHRKYLDRWRGG
jgi:EpsI family protein